MKAKGKVWIAAVVGLLVVVVSLVGIKVGQIRAMIQAGHSFVPPPESVTSVKVAAATWQSRRAAIGTLVAVHDVTLGAELPGLIREVDFDSGRTVKRGALLVRLDTTNEEAQLASAKADAELAKATLERARALRKGGGEHARRPRRRGGPRETGTGHRREYSGDDREEDHSRALRWPRRHEDRSNGGRSCRRDAHRDPAIRRSLFTRSFLCRNRLSPISRPARLPPCGSTRFPARLGRERSAP
jgi:hypothetical protein